MKRIFLVCLLFAASALANVQPINPVFNGTATISCAATSSATSVAALVSAFGQQVQLELQNAGTVAVFLEVGSIAGVAATVATGYPVLAGMSKVISVGRGVTHVACISASGTQTVYVTVGVGN